MASKGQVQSLGCDAKVHGCKGGQCCCLSKEHFSLHLWSVFARQFLQASQLLCFAFQFLAAHPEVWSHLLESMGTNYLSPVATQLYKAIVQALQWAPCWNPPPPRNTPRCNSCLLLTLYSSCCGLFSCEARQAATEWQLVCLPWVIKALLSKHRYSRVTALHLSATKSPVYVMYQDLSSKAAMGISACVTLLMISVCCATTPVTSGSLGHSRSLLGRMTFSWIACGVKRSENAGMEPASCMGSWQCWRWPGGCSYWPHW